MPSLKFGPIGGLIPKMAEWQLPDNGAQKAENLRLISGEIEPVNVPGVVQAIPAGSLTVFPWIRGGATEWLSWLTDVDVVRSPIADDDKARIFYTGDGKPKVKGWVSGAAVTRDMERATAATPAVASSERITDADIASKLAVTATVVISKMSCTPSSVSKAFTMTHASTTRDESGVINLRFTLAESSVGTMTENANWLWAGVYSSITSAFSWDGTAHPIGESFSVSDSDGEVGQMTILGASFDPSPVVCGIVGTDARVAAYALIVRVSLDSVSGDSDRISTYVQTLVDDWGIEGPTSDATALVKCLPGQKVTLSTLGTAPAGYSLRRFYRSATNTDGSNDGTYYFCGECDADETTYVDTKRDADLGDEMPLFENPPDDIKGMVMMAGGFWAAFRGREILFSIPFLPHSCPTGYRLTVDYDVVGLAVTGNELLVTTVGHPYLITGSHPESLTTSKLMVNQSCVSKRGICQRNGMILYPSPDGYVGVVGGSATLVTKDLYSRVEWQALNPSTIIAAVHDDQLFAFTSTTAIILDFANGGALTTTTQTATGLYSDLETDLLYMIQGESLNTWGTGATPMTWTWRSKEFKLPRPYAWTSGRILAIDYTGMTLAFYSENVLASTLNIGSTVEFRIPKMRTERVWSVEISGVGTVHEVLVACNMGALR